MKTSFIFFSAILILTLSWQCQPETSVPVSNLPTEQLAQIHCGSCHQYPSPSLLDKASWNDYVLPRMGFMMGFRSVPDSVVANFEEGELGTQLIDQSKVFHTTPILAPSDWERLQDFYVSKAPQSLIQPKLPSVSTDLTQFKIHIPTKRYSPPGTTLVHFMDDGKILTGDVQKGLLLQFDNQLSFIKEAQVGEGIVWVNDTPNNLWLTVMGNFLASDHQDGYLLKIPKQANKPIQPVVGNLRRPVHTAIGDLNGDQMDDLIISEYGKWMGSLSWWKNTGQGYQKKVLLNQSGAIRSYIQDMNQDGLPDVVALFGQGQEGIYIFYNLGNDQFETKQVLSFHPAMGSSYFTLLDYNKDEHQDILYVSGDNADYRPILRPYQGIYVYENNGKDEFQQRFFYPMHGAYKVIPADFDQDGDLDLAAISFFPDFNAEVERSFLYLENQGQWNFKAYTFPNSKQGRWISMDVSDYDQDGDEDLILGSLAFEIPDPHLKNIQDNWLQYGIPFIVLENQLNSSQ